MMTKQKIGAPLKFPLDNRSLTREAILECVSYAPEVARQLDSRIVRVKSDVVVKYGSSIHISEAYNIQLVREKTNINAPDILDAWSDLACEPTTYIAMTYIEGSLLADVWLDMGSNKQSKILAAVAAMVHELHTLRLDRPGPVGKGAKCSGTFFTAYDAGPFETREDLEAWFNDRMKVCKYIGLSEDFSPFVITDLVMSHMDLHPHNMIIDAKDNIWIIDWGRSGGFPPWLETAELEHTQFGFEGSTDFQQKLLPLIYDDAYANDHEKLSRIMWAFTTGASVDRPELFQ